MGVKKGIAPNRNFTQIPNDLIRNQEVSDGAFRLICWITSHTDGFDISFSGIRSALGYGRDGLRSIIKNAEENNYLVRVKTRDETTGQFDWDYHIFANQQDAITFRESIDGLAAPGVTIDGSAVGGSPTGGTPTGGSGHPHKEYKDVEQQSKKDQLKNTPPTPSVVERAKPPNVSGVVASKQREVIEESGAITVEVEVIPEESQDKVSREIETNNSSISLTKLNPGEERIYATARDNSTTLSRLIEKFEAGEVTKLPPHELKMLSEAMIGDYIKVYRKSGNILSLAPNDIRPEFLAYVEENHLSRKIRNSANASGRIRNIEQEPTQWRSLVEMVQGWMTKIQTSTYEERTQTPTEKHLDDCEMLEALLKADI